MRINYGEEYNRESMYETARDYFLDGKKVKINRKRHERLIDVMIEDFDLEIKKEHYLLRQSEKAFNADDKEKFIDKFAKTRAVRKTTDYLQKRIRDAIIDSRKCSEEDKKMIIKLKQIRNLDKCSMEDLENFLIDLKEYKGIINYRLNGDCVNTLTYKMLASISKLIKDIEDEIKSRQNSLGIKKEH